MQNIIFITKQLNDDWALCGALNQQTQIVQYTDNMSYDNIDFTYVTNLAFMYHYPGFDRVPFFYDNPQFVEKSTYEYFSDTLVELFKHVKSINENVIIDLLTCDLNSQSFKDEVFLVESELGINIRYSVDRTGNNPNGNWILESDDVDVKNVYFNENINDWDVVLAGNFRSTIVDNTSYPGVFSINTDGISGVTTITLLADLTINGNINTNLATWGTTSYILLGNKEVFDGNNKTINFTGVTGIAGLFTSGATVIDNMTTVRNLTVSSGILGSNSAFIVKSSQQFMVVENCSSSGDISTLSSGGIIADLCNEMTITNCHSSGLISGLSSGGIVGPFVKKLSISKCYSTGSITGTSSGGIVGSNCGYNNNIVTVSECYSNGIISGSNSGGIVGRSAGKTGFVTVTNCYSTGNINGIFTGGIAGSHGGSGDSALQGRIDVISCYSTGNITSSGSNAGGIMGSYAGSAIKPSLTVVTNTVNGLANINKCYSTGSISGFGSGGIIGSYAGNVVGGDSNNWSSVVNVTNCYSVGAIGGIANTDSGGIFGYHAGEKTTTGTGTISTSINIENCYSTGTLTGTANGIGKDVSTNSNIILSNCFSAEGGTALLTLPSTFFDSPNTDGSVYASVATSFPILKSFQSLPWITDSGFTSYYNLYNEPAKFNISPPFVVAGNQDVTQSSTLVTTLNWISTSGTYTIGNLVGPITDLAISGTSLTFTPTDVGITTFTVSSGAGSSLYTSSVISITVTIAPIVAPFFVVGSDQSVQQSSTPVTVLNWISPAGSYTVNQMTGPITDLAISGTSLTFTPTDVGITTFTVTSGSDTSRTVTILVSSPSVVIPPFVVGSDQTVLQSSTLATVINWISTTGTYTVNQMANPITDLTIDGTDLTFTPDVAGVTTFTVTSGSYTSNVVSITVIDISTVTISTIPDGTDFMDVILSDSQQSQLSAQQISTGINIVVDLTKTTNLTPTEKFNLIRDYSDKVSNTSLALTKDELQSASGNTSLRGIGTYAVINGTTIDNTFATNGVRNLYFPSSVFTINGVAYISDGVNIRIQLDNTIITQVTLNGIHYAIYAGSGEMVQIVCFAKGTKIMTPDGNVLIEDLKKGDLVLTGDNRSVEIEKVFYNKYKLNSKSFPVVIPKGFHGCTEETLVSFKHGILVDGEFVQAGKLGLGRRKGCGEIEYYNLKLAGHYRTDTLVVNGLIAESWGESNLKIEKPMFA